MFFGRERAVVLVVDAGEALMVVAQRELVLLIDRDVGLAQEHVLLAPDLIGVQFRQEDRLRGGGRAPPRPSACPKNVLLLSTPSTCRLFKVPRCPPTERSPPRGSRTTPGESVAKS